MPSSIVPGIYDAGLADGNFSVRTEDAYSMTSRLAREEGLLVGPSAGAAVFVALRLARSIESGTVVAVLADSAERYREESFWSTETNVH